MWEIRQAGGWASHESGTLNTHEYDDAGPLWRKKERQHGTYQMDRTALESAITDVVRCRRLCSGQGVDAERIQRSVTVRSPGGERSPSAPRWVPRDSDERWWRKVTERPAMDAPWPCVSHGIETGDWKGHAGGGDRQQIDIVVCILLSEGSMMGLTIDRSSLGMVNARSVALLLAEW